MNITIVLHHPFPCIFKCLACFYSSSRDLEVPRGRHVPHRHRAVLAGSVVVVTTSRVHRAAEVVSASLCVHGHLVVVGADGRAEAVLLIASAVRGQEVNAEAPDVEDVDEGDHPFEDGGFVDSAVAALEHAKGNGEAAFDEDEGELDPEAGAEDAMFAEVDSKALVLGANENGRDDVATTVRHC